MDEQQIIREEQGVAQHREQQRERQARARVEETPEQREHRVARRREQDREHQARTRAEESEQEREQRLVFFLKCVIVSLQLLKMVLFLGDGTLMLLHLVFKGFDSLYIFI